MQFSRPSRSFMRRAAASAAVLAVLIIVAISLGVRALTSDPRPHFAARHEPIPEAEGGAEVGGGRGAPASSPACSTLPAYGDIQAKSAARRMTACTIGSL